MTTLFVSDLHLSAERPAKVDLFEAFAARAATSAHALYILGDLFEVWLGDDDLTPTHRRVLAILQKLGQEGVSVYFMPGNRDFLCGDGFARAAGIGLLPDYSLIQLGKTPTLLTHGDLLCTQDVKYQRFRRVVHNRLLQSLFRRTPLAWRRHIANGTQNRTRASMARKAEYIMDVDEGAVAAALHLHGASLLIHGHTHRPGEHEHTVDGRSCRRIVLGDWYEQDSVVVYDGTELHRQRATSFAT